MPCYRLVWSRCAGALSPVLLCVAAVAAAGCGPAPTVTTATERISADADEDGMEPDMPEPAASGERILGAFVRGPALEEGAPAWLVFKLRGRPEAVGKRAADFDRFLASLRIPAAAGAMPVWELPGHWRSVPPTDQVSVRNIRTGHPQTPLDITFSAVGGSLVENINRWQDQVGMPRTAEADLPTVWREAKAADGKPVYRLDLKGPGGKKQMMRPPFAKN